MSATKLGLKSEELRTAFAEALAGRSARLGDLLARHGGLPGPRPNLALAAGFGQAAAESDQRVRKLLDGLAGDPAPADQARAFLPAAAANGYVARIERDPAHAWAGVFELAADDRGPVRVALVEALAEWTAQGGGRLDALVARAAEWLGHDDREHALAAQAVVLEVVGSRRRLETLQDGAALFAWLEDVWRAIIDAPRSAERWPARRAVLRGLPLAFAEAVATAGGARDVDPIGWLGDRAAEAKGADLREAMERTIDRLRGGARAQPTEAIQALQSALAVTAKIPRDPTRVRERARGRGKKAKRRSR